eukprot:1936226-Rhodomonas_salina.2
MKTSLPALPAFTGVDLWDILSFSMSSVGSFRETLGLRARSARAFSSLLSVLSRSSCIWLLRWPSAFIRNRSSGNAFGAD